MQILYAVVSLGGMGLAFGLLLAAASKYLSVKQDERIPLIIEKLPNANCGGCGFAGCSAYAAAVVNGEAPVTGCPVGGAKAAEEIAKIMGVTAGASKPMKAVVLCCGKTGDTAIKYQYDGLEDCAAANRLGGGQKACQYSCLGYGNCVKACAFDAIHVENGIAVVNEKCVACGKCVEACPKNLIQLVPKDADFAVICSSKDKGAAMKEKCTVGCIGCGICAKNCPADAITMQDNLAVIDYEKCVGCGICAEKCPKKVIRDFFPERATAHVK